MSVFVRVPASSANLGSGVDCMGVALSLYLRVSFREADETRFTFLTRPARASRCRTKRT